MPMSKAVQPTEASAYIINFPSYSHGTAPWSDQPLALPDNSELLSIPELQTFYELAQAYHFHVNSMGKCTAIFV